MKVTKRLAAYAVKYLGVKEPTDKAAVRKAVASAINGKKLTPEKLAKLQRTKAAVPAGAGAPKSGTRIVDDQGNDLGRGSAGGFFKEMNNIRVKEAADRYDDSRTAAVFPMLTPNGLPHPMAGQPVTRDGRKLYNPSQRDYACMGAFFKMTVANALMQKQQGVPKNYNGNDHDRELIQHALHHKEWGGVIGANSDGDNGEALAGKLTELQRKTLIADVNSGGLFAVPAAFDDAIVMYPILYGQLAPYVTVKDTNSNRVQGALMNRPRITSGAIEGTAVAPFDTTGFLSAFDNPIWNAQGSMELGKDLEDDSPAAIGQTVSEMFGQEHLAWLDRVIAYGDGRVEPLGICRTSGAYLILSSYGPGGPLTVADFTNLQFGVDLAIRQEANSYRVYLSNDNMYRMSRNIQVAPNDERRAYVEKTQAYMMNDDPFAIQNNIPNGIVAYANLRRFRLYRRLGIQITIDDTGYTLRTRNTRLIVARMRYGGRMDYAGAVALMNDGQSQ